jgi:hypothetical protein
MASLRRIFRMHLREAGGNSAGNADLDELEALLFSSSVSIRVLGRAGMPATLLRGIASAALSAVSARLQPNEYPRSQPGKRLKGKAR